jgi:hypothetical protein
MTTDTLKGTQITALDTTQPAGDIQSAGFGAPNYSKSTVDGCSATAAGLAATTSTYRILRFPSQAVLKELYIECPTQLDSNGSPTLAIDVGAYYSDSTIDGTAPANQGTSISVNCFLAAKTFGSVAGTRQWALTALSTVALRNQPLWEQAGLTSDPGGYIDVVVAVHTAAATGVAGLIIAQATAE